ILSEIGQKISSTLDLENILETVYTSVNKLMDASAFGISVFNKKEGRLEFKFSIDKSERQPTRYVELTNEKSFCIWCIKNGKDVFINDMPLEYSKYTPSGTTDVDSGDATESAIFIPLIVEKRIIGTIDVQSYEKNAYTTNHLEIMRTIASHTAVALDNALAYEQLNKAHQELNMLSMVARKTDNYVIITDRNDEIEWVNEGFTHITGYKLKDVLKKNPGKLLRGKLTSDKEARRIDKLKKDKKPFTAELLNYGKKGEPIWLYANVTPVLDQNKSVERYITVGSDITEWKRAEEKIQTQNKELEESYNNITILSEIGRQLTSTLEFEAIFNKLHEKVNQLMSADCLGVRIYHPDKNIVEYKYEVEKGKRHVSADISMDDDNNYTVWCIKNKKEIFINDNKKEYKKYTKEIVVPRGDMTDSLIFYPMVFDKKVLGVITVQSFAKNAYTKYHLNILKTLASYTAQALNNADAYEHLNKSNLQLEQKTSELQESYKDTKLLSTLGKSITSCFTVEKIIEVAYENVNKLMEASSLAIGVYNKQLNRLEFPGVIEKGKLLPIFTVSLDQDDQMPVVCFKKKQDILINNMEKEAKAYIGVSPDKKALKGEVTSALIYLPLFIKTRGIGVISVQSFEKNVYTTYNLDMLRSLAVYVSIALENARGYELVEEKVKERTAEVVKQKHEIEKAYQDVELLSGIGKDITSTLSVEEIIEKVYINANALMDAAVFSIGIYNEKEQTLEFKGGKEKGKALSQYHYRMDVTRIAVWCFKNQKNALINDYQKELTNYIGKIEPVIIGDPPESLMYLPLNYNQKRIGVITVQSFEKNAYTDYHLKILLNIAVYSAIALENAHLYENTELKVKDRTKEIEKQKKELEISYNNINILSEIGQKISSTLDLENILETVYRSVNKLMDATAFSISVFNEKEERLEFNFFIDKSERIPAYYVEMTNEKSLAIWCIKNGKDVFMNNYTQQEIEKYIPSGNGQVIGDAPESVIFIPLIVEKRIIGTISVQSYKKNAYTTNHLQMLKTIASYTAVALDNATAYENLDRLREDLEETNKDIEDSMRYASKIQQTMLPPRQAVKKHLPNSFILNHPRDIVSGDFYWMETIKATKKTIIAAVDCTGHGVPGAFLTIVGNNLLNRIVIEQEITKPGEILKELNNGMIEWLHRDKKKESIRDGMDISLCTIDNSNGAPTLIFAGAQIHCIRFATIHL
ncbi:MAG: GAF domain-containing protein, partial [Flavobacteriales bacterium]|nr:GAF domain-containing protein [Flavobacteriales bacterium]